MRIETENWQGWLQEIVSLVGFGYHYYSVVKYPVEKKDKWRAIDEKMLVRFDVVDKHRRARRKRTGMANFHVIRFERTLVILHTEGELPPGVDLSRERFFDVRKQPLQLSIGRLLRLNVSKASGKVEVCMPNDFFADVRANIEELAKIKSLPRMKSYMQRLGGIPGYRGINDQRRQLVDVAVENLKANHIKASWKDFTFYTGRKTRKVYKDD